MGKCCLFVCVLVLMLDIYIFLCRFLLFNLVICIFCDKYFFIVWYKEILKIEILLFYVKNVMVDDMLLNKVISYCILGVRY